MTKIPTAIAIMQLREQGRLNLDDGVTEYLPWFEVTYPSDIRQAITIRDLLQHTSGLPDTVPAIIGWVHYDDATRDQTEIVKTYLPNYRKLKFEPRQKASYSNLNYMVLGAIIESVSGQSYETYITENILDPLGMSQTGFVYTPSMAKHEALGSLPLIHLYTPLLPGLLDTNALIPGLYQCHTFDRPDRTINRYSPLHDSLSQPRLTGRESAFTTRICLNADGDPALCAPRHSLRSVRVCLQMCPFCRKGTFTF